jgi:drug/metabolite transporter (DMT)-like permease
MTDHPPASPSLARGRLYVVIAAVMWSFSSVFNKVLREDTFLGLNDPPVDPRVMACFRTLFAGSVLLLVLRPRDLTFRPLMLVMAGCFAAMNILFISAMSYGTAANAILLQYTAPMWTFLACVWWLKEPPDRQSFVSVLIGLVGIAIIIVGGWKEAQLSVIRMGLGAGLTYAGVLICLRVLRHCSSAWLTVVNFLVSSLVLLPVVLPLESMPTFGQWVVLFLYGVVQMGIPYVLMARALQSVSPQEAGAITLLEPLLNPVWAFLVAREVPSVWTILGGGFILGGLAWRYWPRRTSPLDASAALGE